MRDVRPAAWLDLLARDVRYATRMLVKAPAFSLTATLVMALGVGANSAVFSAVNILLFQPPPWADQPGLAVSLHVHDPARPDSYRPFTFEEYETIRDQSGLFDHVLAHMPVDVSVTYGDETRRVEAALASGSYFETLGVGLAAGRTFTGDEERPESGAAVAVLSYTAWRRMGGRAEILGSAFFVNARPFTIIGIAPEGFAGPVRIAGPDFWMPFGAVDLLRGSPGPGAPARAASRPTMMIAGRLKPGLTLESANAALRARSASLQLAGPRGETSPVLTAARLTGRDQGDRPPNDDLTVLIVPFAALMGAALIVLMVASLNVANMQLARGTTRRKEIAVRLALGARRLRVVRQLLLEGLLLAGFGGVAGLLLAVWAMHLVRTSLAPRITETLSMTIAPDWRVCFASLIVCGMAAVASGLGPAWKLSRLDLMAEVRSQEGTGTGRTRRLGPQNLLVAGQIALSLALLAASGLFVRAAALAGRADPGYRFDGQLLLRLDAVAGGYDRVSGRDAYTRLLEHVRAMPGVDSAALASAVAFSSDPSGRLVWREGAAPRAGSNRPPGRVAQSYNIGSAYFRTLGLAPLRGREFTDAEAQDPRATGVAIINEPLASALFPGQDPLGQSIQVAEANVLTLRVVGVVPGLRSRLTDRGPIPQIYFPLGPRYRAVAHLHVRVADGANTGDLQRRLRGVPRTAGSRLALLWVGTLEEARDASPDAWLIRSAGSVFGAFGAIALFMATIGLYGVKAYLVARRTREIGIRVALGARAGDVVRMIVRDGAILLGLGVAVGLLLAAGAGWAIASLLVGVTPFDPLVLGLVTFVLSAAVLAACYAPARRASRLSPVTALRVE